jgi:hypothetical protein
MGAHLLHVPQKWIVVGIICLVGLAIVHGVTEDPTNGTAMQVTVRREFITLLFSLHPGHSATVSWPPHLGPFPCPTGAGGAVILFHLRA